MKTYTCKEKLSTTPSKKYDKYVLVDEVGTEIIVDSEQLRQQMMNNQVQITNLKLSLDNKIVNYDITKAKSRPSAEELENKYKDIIKKLNKKLYEMDLRTYKYNKNTGEASIRSYAMPYFKSVIDVKLYLDRYNEIIYEIKVMNDTGPIKFTDTETYKKIAHDPNISDVILKIKRRWLMEGLLLDQAEDKIKALIWMNSEITYYAKYDDDKQNTYNNLKIMEKVTNINCDMLIQEKIIEICFNDIKEINQIKDYLLKNISISKNVNHIEMLKAFIYCKAINPSMSFSTDYIMSEAFKVYKNTNEYKKFYYYKIK